MTVLHPPEFDTQLIKVLSGHRVTECPKIRYLISTRAQKNTRSSHLVENSCPCFLGLCVAALLLVLSETQHPICLAASRTVGSGLYSLNGKSSSHYRLVLWSLFFFQALLETSNVPIKPKRDWSSLPIYSVPCLQKLESYQVSFLVTGGTRCPNFYPLP